MVEAAKLVTCEEVAGAAVVVIVVEGLVVVPELQPDSIVVSIMIAKTNKVLTQRSFFNMPPLLKNAFKK